MNLRMLLAGIVLVVGNGYGADELCDAQGVVVQDEPQAQVKSEEQLRSLAKQVIDHEDFSDAKQLLEGLSNAERSVVRYHIREALALWITKHGSRDRLKEKVDMSAYKQEIAYEVSSSAMFFGSWGCAFSILCGALHWSTWSLHTHRAAEKLQEFFADSAVCKDSASLKHHVTEASNSANGVRLAGGALCVSVLVAWAGLTMKNKLVPWYEAERRPWVPDVEKYDRIVRLIKYLG